MALNDENFVDEQFFDNIELELPLVSTPFLPGRGGRRVVGRKKVASI